MSFECSIQFVPHAGRLVPRVYVPLAVVTPAGDIAQFFRFDTGADLTTVSEDVAARLVLPAGGAAVHVTGSTGGASGRLVTVEFRFPPDMLSGLVRPPVTSVWAVVPGRTRLALLSFSDAEPWFYLVTDDRYMTFNDR